MSTVFLIMCDYLWKIVSKTAFISLCTRNLKPSCLVSSNFHVFVSFSPPHCIRQIPKFFKQTNKMAKRWHLSRLYCCVISILYPLCLFQTLHPVNNENKVRGLWGVIIFHLGDSGGAALHLSHPFMTVHYLPPTVMSTRLSLSVGDGTSEIKAKNKCYISLSTYNKRKKIQQSWCHELSWESDLWKYCLLEKYKNTPKKGRVKGTDEFNDTYNQHHTRSLWFYLYQQ